MAAILVTGSTGYVGRNLLNKCVEALPSVRFVGLTRSMRKADSLGIEHVRFVTGDINRPETMSSAFEDVQIVIHLAAEINPRDRDAFFRTNVVGTQNVVALSQKARVRRFLLLSSFDVSHSPSTRYSESKRQAEEVVMHSGLDYFILRPTVIYGGEGTTPVTQLESLVMHSPFVPVVGTGKQKIQPLHVDDLIGIIFQALSAPYSNAVYEIGGPERFTHIGLIREIKRLLGKSGPSLPVPIPPLLVKLMLTPFSSNGRVKNFMERIYALSQDKVASNDRLLRDFEIKFTRFSDGLMETGLRKFSRVPGAA